MSDLFSPTGVHILAGGQYGSEGKGLLASWLADCSIDEIIPWAGVITSAGPNSGHTSWFQNEKIVLKQLPTFAVHLHLRGWTVPVYFSAGSIIDANILMEEHRKFPGIDIFIHTNAVVLSKKDIDSERDPNSTIFAVAGTRSGTGAALARKIHRDPSAIYNNTSKRLFPYYERIVDTAYAPYFMEVSQGFSLGINDPKFYPKVTSRECTFAQAMADARIPVTSYKKGYLCFRTYPIRVGNVDGHDSGEWYPDQNEMEWDEIGVPAEMTTVTKRIRRVATWSWQQFADSVEANDPTHVFLNFMNYFPQSNQRGFLVEHERRRNERQYKIIYGFGPRMEDVEHQNSPAIALLRA